MTNEEIVAMIKSKDKPDSSLMAELYQQNRGMMYLLASKWQRGCVTIDDLMQEGYIALINAVRDYDESKGGFSSYLRWKLTAVFHYEIATKSSMIRMPNFRHDQVVKWRKERERYIMVHGKEPTTKIMAGILGVGLDKAETIEKCAAAERAASLDAEIMIGSDGETVSLMDTLPDSRDDIGASTDEIASDQIATDVWKVVDALGGREAEVIRAKYQEGKTLDQIGERFGISKQFAHQIEKKSLKRIRMSKNATRLRSYLEMYSAGLKGTGVARFQETGTSATERVALQLVGCPE